MSTSNSGRRGRWKGAGQALVEFALILPILILLIMGIVEFGRAWSAFEVVTDAGREGARLAVIDNAAVYQDSVVHTVESALTRAGLQPSSATIEMSGWRGGRGTPLSLKVSYHYHMSFLAPFMGWVGDGGAVNLTTTAVMRNE